MTNRLTTVLIAILILTLISGLGTAAEIIVQPGNSIQTAVNSSSPGDIITVKPGTYTENIKISKANITIRSESGDPDNTIIKYKNAATDVFLLQGNYIKISGFKIIGVNKSPYAGINLSSCSNCVIENNKLVDDARGIYLLRSSGNTVSRNDVTNSIEYGIVLQNAVGNTVSGNTASGNQRGVYFGTSDNNVFSSNNVQKNSVYGFFICGLSDGNKVFNNYFNNTNMTIRNGIGNSYNTTKAAGTNIVGGPYIGGNFWGKPDGKGFSQTAVDKDGDGISDAVYKNITSSINSDKLPLVIYKPISPSANFTTNITSGTAPLNVAFTDNSTGSPTVWSWNFGDGAANSTQQNTTHNYSVAGNYTVILTVSNSAGSNTTIKTNYIKVIEAVQKPVADFTSNVNSGIEPLNVKFADNSTGKPTEWNWNFGDGTENSTIQNSTHNYSTPGNYTVTLTVSNSAGNSSVTKTNYINVIEAVRVPEADFTSNITSGTEPLNVVFTDNSTKKPTEWNWSFGDGTENSTIQNPTHNYSTPGNYTVTLTASNSAGSNTTIKSSYINVAEAVKVPVADFTSNVTSGIEPLNVTFTDNSKGKPIEWNWNFGDGTENSTVQNPTHNYSTAGNYTVILTVGTSAGNNTTEKIDYINIAEAVKKPVADFNSSITSGTEPLTVTFADNSTRKPTEWNWSFGDGTGNSTVQNPTHKYSTPGNYTVILTVGNSAGNSSVTKTNYINVIEAVKVPEADFTSNIISGTEPLNVVFTDNSTKKPTEWNWSFGDGTENSTQQNPAHTYSTAGNYTVTLTASNSAGSNTTIKSSYINVAEAVKVPVADFMSNVTSEIEPLDVAFADNSTGKPTEWNWSFGDGTENSTVKNPMHTYSVAGNYTVTLTASNSAGSSTATKTSYITVNAAVKKPVAGFSSNVTSGTAPFNVAFTDTSTNTPTVWNWSFGDGTTNSTAQNPTHNYSTAGNYTVILTVSNSAGSNTTTKSSFINVAENNTTKVVVPVVSFWGSKTSGTAPITITFTDASTNTPTAWNWSFGDGTYSTEQKPKHTYSTAGTYSITLTASNTAGSATKTRANYITLTGTTTSIPVANFSSNVTSGTAPLNVAFTDASTNTPTAWNWSFGDGTTNSTVQNPTHNYSTAGNYTVTLTASNSAGSNTTTKSSYINVAEAVDKPRANFTSNVTSGVEPLDVAFADNSTGKPTEWNWNFGDGTENSTVQNPTHKYSTSGNYTVTLTVSNSAGNSSVTKTNYINVIEAVKKPIADFSSSITSGIEPLNVVFTDNSTGKPTEWNWSFGDGTTNSTVQNPTHNYSTPGNYTVTLTVSNSAGSGTATKTSYITVNAAVKKPVAGFSSNVTSGTAPFNVAFTDTSTNTPTAWNWSFGDGTTNSTVQNPTHNYSTAGNYTVILTVSNSAGSNTTTKSSFINVAENNTTKVVVPVVSFWGSKTSGTAPITIGFTDASTNTPTAWNWSFGDGTYSTLQNPKHTYSAAGNYSITLKASNTAGNATKTRANYIKIT